MTNCMIESYRIFPQEHVTIWKWYFCCKLSQFTHILRWLRPIETIVWIILCYTLSIGADPIDESIFIKVMSVSEDQWRTFFDSLHKDKRCPLIIVPLKGNLLKRSEVDFAYVVPSSCQLYEWYNHKTIYEIIDEILESAEFVWSNTYLWVLLWPQDTMTQLKFHHLFTCRKRNVSWYGDFHLCEVVKRLTPSTERNIYCWKCDL